MAPLLRISVVLASFNGAPFIEAQLRSLLDALGPDDEIVVSDDGSADRTRDVVASVQDPRVRLLPSGPRLGYQGNFERAIAAARGRYVFFSDQDDVCLPARIPRSLEALQSCQCVCGDAEVVDANLAPLAPSYFALRRAKRFTPFELFVRPPVIGATMACTREFLAGVLPLPRHLPHDQWLTILAAAAGQLTVVQAPFILYRRHASTVSPTAGRGRRSLHTVIRERLRLAWALATRPRPSVVS